MIRKFAKKFEIKKKKPLGPNPIAPVEWFDNNSGKARENMNTQTPITSLPATFIPAPGPYANSGAFTAELKGFTKIANKTYEVWVNNSTLYMRTPSKLDATIYLNKLKENGNQQAFVIEVPVGQENVFHIAEVKGFTKTAEQTHTEMERTFEGKPFWVIYTGHFKQEAKTQGAAFDRNCFESKIREIFNRIPPNQEYGSHFGRSYVYFEKRYNEMKNYWELALITCAPDAYFNTANHPNAKYIELGCGKKTSNIKGFIKKALAPGLELKPALDIDNFFDVLYKGQFIGTILKNPSHNSWGWSFSKSGPWRWGYPFDLIAANTLLAEWSKRQGQKTAQVYGVPIIYSAAPQLNEQDFYNFYGAASLVNFLSTAESSIVKIILNTIENFCYKILSIAKSESIGPLEYAIRNNLLPENVYPEGINSFLSKLQRGEVPSEKIIEILEKVNAADSNIGGRGSASYRISRAAADLERFLPVLPNNAVQVVFQVDHMVDIMHNTGLMLDGHVSLSKGNIYDFLDEKTNRWDWEFFKTHAPQMYNIYQQLSRYAKVKSFTKKATNEPILFTIARGFTGELAEKARKGETIPESLSKINYWIRIGVLGDLSGVDPSIYGKGDGVVIAKTITLKSDDELKTYKFPPGWYQIDLLESHKDDPRYHIAKVSPFDCDNDLLDVIPQEILGRAEIVSEGPIDDYTLVNDSKKHEISSPRKDAPYWRGRTPTEKEMEEEGYGDEIKVFQKLKSFTKIAGLEEKIELLTNKYFKLHDKGISEGNRRHTYKFESNRTDKERHDDFKELITELAAEDPTSNKQYLEWIVRQIVVGDYMYEAQELHDLLQRFEKAKKSRKIPIDINVYKTTGQLYDAVEKVEGEGGADWESGAPVVLDKPPYKVIRLDNQQAAAKLCRGTEWCVRAPNMYKEYAEQGPLYLVYKNDEKYAMVHYESGQVKDSNDRPVSLEQAKELVKLLEPITSISFKDIEEKAEKKTREQLIEILSEAPVEWWGGGVSSTTDILNMFEGMWGDEGPFEGILGIDGLRQLIAKITQEPDIIRQMQEADEKQTIQNQAAEVSGSIKSFTKKANEEPKPIYEVWLNKDTLYTRTPSKVEAANYLHRLELNGNDQAFMKELLPNELVPETPEPVVKNASEIKTFYLNRQEDETGISGTGKVAFGIVLPTGRVAIEWTSAHSSITVFENAKEMDEVHGHHGKTKMVFTTGKSPKSKDDPSIRPFVLNRFEDETGISGTGKVAHGAVLPSGKVVIEWTTDNKTIEIFKDIEEMMSLHGHNGKTQIEYTKEVSGDLKGFCKISIYSSSEIPEIYITSEEIKDPQKVWNKFLTQYWLKKKKNILNKIKEQGFTENDINWGDVMVSVWEEYTKIVERRLLDEKEERLTELSQEESIKNEKFIEQLDKFFMAHIEKEASVKGFCKTAGYVDKVWKDFLVQHPQHSNTEEFLLYWEDYTNKLNDELTSLGWTSAQIEMLFDRLDDKIMTHIEKESFIKGFTKTSQEKGLTIGIDIDDVIADTHKVLLEVARQYIPIDENDAKQHYVQDMKHGSKELRNKIFEEMFDKHLIANMPTLPGAVEKINELYDKGNKIILITARSDNWRPQTEEWLKNIGLKYNKFITTSGDGKSRYAREEGVDVFIDDRADWVESLVDVGDIKVFVFDQPWNTEVALPRIKDWRQVKASNKYAQYSSATAYEWQQAFNKAQVLDDLHEPSGQVSSIVGAPITKENKYEYQINLRDQLPSLWQEVLVSVFNRIPKERWSEVYNSLNQYNTDLLISIMPEGTILNAGYMGSDEAFIELKLPQDRIADVMQGNLEAVEELDSTIAHELRHALDDIVKSKGWRIQEFMSFRPTESFKEYTFRASELSAIEEEIAQQVRSLKEQGYPLEMIHKKIVDRFSEQRGFKDPKIEEILNDFIDNAYHELGVLHSSLVKSFTKQATHLDAMKDFFKERTLKHISLVKKYLNRLNKHYSYDFKEEDHDKSKFEDPEYEPYLYITWKHKSDNENEDYEIPDEWKDRCHEATFHHVKTNKHHPEYWDSTLTENPINKEDRDKPSDKVVDATKMPKKYILEMVADWCAMSEEKGNTPKEWADKNMGVRWEFSPEQKDLIYEAIDLIWDEKKMAGVKSIIKFSSPRWTTEDKNRLKDLYLKYRQRGIPYHIIYKAAAHLLNKSWLAVKQKLESMYDLDDDLKGMKFEHWDKDKIDQTIQDLYRGGKPISRLKLPPNLMYQITNHSMPKSVSRNFPTYYDSFDNAMASNILAVGFERDGDKLTEKPIKTLEDALKHYRRKEKMCHTWNKDEIVELLQEAHVVGLPLTYSFFRSHPDIYKPLLGVGRSLEGLRDSVKRNGYTWDKLVIEAVPQYIEYYSEDGKLIPSTEELRVRRFLELNNIPFRVPGDLDKIAVNDPDIVELGFQHFIPDFIIHNGDGDTMAYVEVFGSIADSMAANTSELYREKKKAKEKFYSTLPCKFISINNNTDGIDLTDEILKQKFSTFLGM